MIGYGNYGVETLIAASNALRYKGATDCSSNPNYPAADAGDVYVVSVAGKIGGASGVTVEAGDMFICKTDGTAAGTQAQRGAQWNVVQSNVVGALVSANNLSDVGSASTARTNLGLGNVDNTSDANKPVSTATQTALDAKFPTASILRAYQAADLSKTNSTFANTDLSVTVEASGKYQFELYGFVTLPSATPGFKFDLNGGTATISNGLLQWFAYQSDDSATSAAGLQTGLSDTFAPGFAPEGEKTFFVQLLGSLEANAGGTFMVRFAQSVTDASASLFLKGSTLVLIKIN